MPKPLTAQQLRERLLYDPVTGEFRRVSKHQPQSGWKLAGTLHSGGYVQIGVGNSLYFDHRLAWLYMTGSWPKHDVDHFNGARTDNRFANLRDIERYENHENQTRVSIDNRCGFLGVKKTKTGYQARICKRGKQMYLGVYPTPELAHQRYLAAKSEFHPTSFLAGDNKCF